MGFLGDAVLVVSNIPGLPNDYSLRHRVVFSATRGVCFWCFSSKSALVQLTACFMLLFELLNRT